MTVSEYACKMPAVKMGFAAGDRFYLKDLLYALMLESYNDAAVAIAEHIAGSVEGFADKMNQKAAELGCENSHFITPMGWTPRMRAVFTVQRPMICPGLWRTVSGMRNFWRLHVRTPGRSLILTDPDLFPAEPQRAPVHDGWGAQAARRDLRRTPGTVMWGRTAPGSIPIRLPFCLRLAEP